MNKIIYIIILLLTCRICEGQNLIPNGDFETYSSCPTGYSQIPNAVPWDVPTLFCSTDYYHQCASNWVVGVPVNGTLNGYQPAHSGMAYSGIYVFNFNDGREYLSISLTSALIAGQCYHFEMYVNLHNSFQITTSSIEAYLSDTVISGISNSANLPFLPQITNIQGNVFDTLSWTLVSANYVAQGGENFLIIGNFKDNVNTDTMLVSPQGFPMSYVLVDDVCLAPCGSSCGTTDIEEQNESELINISPNPFNNKLNITVEGELSEFYLYDIATRILFQKKFTNSVSLNTEQLAKGIYIYEVRNKNGLYKKGKIVKN